MRRPVAGMKVRVYRVQRSKPDVCRKQCPESLLQSAAAKPSVIGESDHLSARMDAGVSSSGALDASRPAIGQSRESAFELSLHRPPGSLDLETGEVSAVVFNPRDVTNGGVLSGALCCAALAGQLGPQTSSSWTIGAASPARGPSLMMRV